MLKRKEMKCVGKVVDEYGTFYIVRNSEVVKDNIINKNPNEYTGRSIQLPKKLVFFGSFIVNNQAYFYLKENKKKLKE